jgi:hypothetical protein
MEELIMKTLDGVWTQFWDMHSGGVVNVPPYTKIYVQAEEDKAEKIFEEVTGEYPYWVNCECCGGNYAVGEHTSLAQATGYDRNCLYKSGQYIEEQDRDYKPHLTLEEYIEQESVLLIFSDGSTNKLVDGDE